MLTIFSIAIYFFLALHPHCSHNYPYSPVSPPSLSMRGVYTYIISTHNVFAHTVHPLLSYCTHNYLSTYTVIWLFSESFASFSVSLESYSLTTYSLIVHTLHSHCTHKYPLLLRLLRGTFTHNIFSHCTHTALTITRCPLHLRPQLF